MDNYILEYFQKKAQVFFIAFNREGDIVHYNQYAEELMGENLFGKNIKNIFLDFNSQLEIMDLIGTTNQLMTLNLSDRDSLPVSLYFSFYKHEELILGFGQPDLSEYRIVYEELLSLNNELNMASRKLQKQKAELQKLNDLKSHFLSIAAHDLRNPIGNIIAFSELISERIRKYQDNRMEDFIKNISDLSKYSLTLLNDVLEHIRLDSGEMRIKLTICDLNAILKESVSLNKLIAERKQIKIHFISESDVINIYADRNAMMQVINNILNNAIKYSFKSSNIQISSQVEDKFVKVSVKDEGQGIQKEEIEKLFKPFSKTSSTPTDNELSTGLGLSIVKKIINSHNGEIWVDSTVGKGSTFYYTIPIAKTHHYEQK